MKPVQRLEPSGVNFEPASNRLVVWGIHGDSDSVIGLCVGNIVLSRLPYNGITGAPAESVDALRIRAMRNLPPDASRDSKGSAMGYFIYAGLDPDYCRGALSDEEG